MLCRNCGALLYGNEEDICKHCFNLEREDNPPISRARRISPEPYDKIMDDKATQS